MVKKLIMLLVCFAVGFVVGIYVGTEREMDWLVPPESLHPDLELQGYAVYVGLAQYANRHDGLLPQSIRDLTPEYVGSTVDLEGYELLCPGQQMWRFVKGRPFLGVVTGPIARKVVHTKEGNFTVTIYGHGEVVLHLRRQLED